MKTKDFEKKLQAEVDKNLTIKHDERSPAGISGVYYNDRFITGCPAEEIREKPDNGYGVEIDRGNGNYIFIRHRTIEETIAIVSGTIANIKNDKDYSDAFFGEGEYTEDKLK